MDLSGWNALLFALKWVWFGLVYLLLSVVLLAVRREASLRMVSAESDAPAAPGRLRVVKAGEDPAAPANAVLPLSLVTTIGSEPGSDLQLRDRQISRQHARLRWDGAGWWVEDLGSRNGTWVNQARLQPFVPQEAPPGAIIQVGDMSFELLD